RQKGSPCLSPRARGEPAALRRAAQDHRRRAGTHVGRGDRGVSEAGNRGAASCRLGAAERGIAMTAASLVDAKVIKQFLRAQHFRHPATSENYAGTLRNFAGFVSKYCNGAAPTISIVQQWLKERSLKWPAHILYHRTFLVERYLKWLQEHGVIGSNPFAELH